MRQFFRLRVIPGEEPNCELSAVNTSSCWKNGYLSLLEGGSQRCTIIFTIAQSMSHLEACTFVWLPHLGKSHQYCGQPFPGKIIKLSLGNSLAVQRTSLLAQMVKYLVQCGRPVFDCWVRKIPWRREWQITLVFLPGEFHGQRNPWAIVHGVTKSQIRLSNYYHHHLAVQWLRLHTLTAKGLGPLLG